MTLFVILGLVILILLVGFVLFLKAPQEAPKSDTVTSNVRDFIDTCIESTALQGAYTLGSQGGYYKFASITEPFNVQFQEVDYSIGYVYRYESSPQNILLSITDMEKQYEEFMENELQKCIEDFAIFSDLGQIDIDTKKPSADVSIQEDKVFVEVDYPVTIKNKESNSISKISDFQRVTIPVRMGHIRDIIQRIIELTIAKPDSVAIDYIDDLAVDNIHVVYGSAKAADTNPGTVYYVINDFESSIEKNNIIHKPHMENRLYMFNVAFDFTRYTNPKDYNDLLDPEGRN